MHLVFSMAKELVRLSLSGVEQDPLTNLRLQKLLYYAQGWSLVIRESELFPEEIEAWRSGPVVPDVFRDLLAGDEVNPVRLESFTQVGDLGEEQALYLRRVWESYGSYSAGTLSRMTTRELPWLRARTGRADAECGDPIQIDDLDEFFRSQDIPAPLAAHLHELRRREEAAAAQLASMPRVDVNRLVGTTRVYTPAAKKLLAESE